MFTRPDALELIGYILAKGFRLVIATNALLLTTSMIDQLAAYKDLQISVSLDSPNAETHELSGDREPFSQRLITSGDSLPKGALWGLICLFTRATSTYSKKPLNWLMPSELGRSTAYASCGLVEPESLRIAS